MIKKLALCVALIVGVALCGVAQLPPKEILKGEQIYQFQDEISLPTLGVENQAQSGTCWSFGITAVLESDIIAKGGKATNISDMWIVRHAYFDKVVKYVRMQGNLNLSVGGAMHDVTEIIKRYGVVPEEVYPGLNYGERYHNFNELDAVLKGYADAIIEGGKPTKVWQRGLNMLLDNYFGERVAGFKWEDSEVSYTPIGYAKSLGLNMDNYVSLTSYMHHPYSEMVALELPDNWMWQKAYNIPIDELMKTMDKILESGRTFGLAVDVTEDGFQTFSGVATIALSDEHKAKRWDYIQQRRQTEFDNFTTTDDHCIQVIGRATNERGEVFYKAKNSWGKLEPYDGYIYLSREYLELKTILVMVDKDVLPSSLKKGLGVK